MKQLIKGMIPDFFIKVIRRMRPGNDEAGAWSGNFSSWDEAGKNCSGYDSDLILEKVKQAVLKVKRGEAEFERDSVVFSEYSYSGLLKNAFLEIAGYLKRLHVIDFGGSLGSTYFQYRRFFKEITDLKWTVVEQENFVTTGNKEISEEVLKFSNSIDQALEDQEKDLLLLSSVLPYLPDPFEFIERAVDYGFRNIIVDRTSFTSFPGGLLTIQQVNKEIYDASYPCWFFDEENFIKLFRGYELVSDFCSEISLPVKVNNHKGYWKGFIFRKK